MLCCVGSGLFHVPIAVYMMIFVPSTIETLDKLPDVQVGPDADAITVIPMGHPPATAMAASEPRRNAATAAPATTFLKPRELGFEDCSPTSGTVA